VLEDSIEYFNEWSHTSYLIERFYHNAEHPLECVSEILLHIQYRNRVAIFYLYFWKHWFFDLKTRRKEQWERNNEEGTKDYEEKVKDYDPAFKHESIFNEWQYNLLFNKSVDGNTFLLCAEYLYGFRFLMYFIKLIVLYPCYFIILMGFRFFDACMS